MKKLTALLIALAVFMCPALESVKSLSFESGQAVQPFTPLRNPQEDVACRPGITGSRPGF